MLESILIIVITIFVLISRLGKNDSVGSSLIKGYSKIMSKIMPYDYDDVKSKAKELGQSFDAKQYTFQFILFLLCGGGVAFYMG